jgi:hypothetical protein
LFEIEPQYYGDFLTHGAIQTTRPDQIPTKGIEKPTNFGSSADI